MKIIAALFLGLLISSAQAATVAVTQGSGTNMLVKQDGSSNNAPSVTLCDAANPDNCAPISATLGLTVQGNGTAGSPSGGVLSIQGVTSGQAVPISGSVSLSGTLPAFASVPSVSQSGTWTVQPGNTANTTAWLVTGTAGTFPATQSGTWNLNNVSGTVSLPTGAATAANQTAPQGATGSAAPANAVQAGAVSSGNLVGLVQADNSVAINVSTATTTQLVALSSGKRIYVTSFNVVAAGTGNITLEYGTGTNCGTGTTALTGAYNLTAQNGVATGNGLGAVLVVPSGNALCALTSAAVQMSGSVSYTQF